MQNTDESRVYDCNKISYYTDLKIVTRDEIVRKWSKEMVMKFKSRFPKWKVMKSNGKNVNNNG